MEYHWMKKIGLVCSVMLTVALFGCSDDDDPTDPGGGGNADTTAPTVSSVTPSDGALMVRDDQSIAITFNEPMDRSSVVGQITMSDGFLDGITWTSDSVLNVGHMNWPAGSMVTITLGTGLKDVAGNALAAPVVITYGTWSDNLFVFGTTPAGGAADINRAASIVLDFGAEMMGGTIETGITISDATKVLHPFTASSDDGATWLLDPTNILPADTEITVTIGTGVMSQYETSFAEPYSFSFTTNDQTDVTPPTIVSIDPASGSTMPTNQQAIVFTFSEPIDPNNFKPRTMNGQLQWLLLQSISDPSWSPAGDVLTVPLPGDLPAGLPLEAVFADYSDLAGNVQTGETAWTCTVAGTPDPYPVADGKRGLMFGEWAEGNLGSEIPFATGQDWVYTQFTSRATAGQWNDEEWEDENYTVLDYYDIQTVSAAGVDVIGFAEQDTKAFTEFFLDQPLTMVEFPFVQGNTWTGTSSAVLPEGTLNVVLDAEVVGQMDLLVGEFDGIVVTWTDVWKVDFTLDISADESAIATETTETWYAPGVGVVRERYREDRVEMGDEGWDTSDRWLYLFPDM